MFLIFLFMLKQIQYINLIWESLRDIKGIFFVLTHLGSIATDHKSHPQHTFNLSFSTFFRKNTIACSALWVA